jgi:hypothetical protein
MLLSPKASLVILADAGESGANPDHQVVGISLRLELRNKDR